MALWTPADHSALPYQWFDAADLDTITFSGVEMAGVGPYLTHWRSKGTGGTVLHQPTQNFQCAYWNYAFDGRMSVYNPENGFWPTDIPIPAAFRLYSAQYVLGNQNTLLGGAGHFIPLSEFRGSSNQIWRVNNVNALGPQTIYKDGVPVSVTNRALLHNTFTGEDRVISIRNLSPANNFRLFQTDNSTYRPNGLFGEIIMVPESSFASQEDDDRFVGYLAWKWGIEGSLPANHPYKNAAPQTSVVVPPDPPPAVALYQGSMGWAARHLGTRTDQQIYLGAKTLR